MLSKKRLKNLYGVMFEIRTSITGKKECFLTQDLKRAAYIVTPKTKKRCPYCSSNKCLTNIVGESRFPREHYLRREEGLFIRFLNIATCRNTGKEFIIAKSDMLDSVDEGQCIWCGSAYTQKISNLEDTRRSLFRPPRNKEYRLLILRKISRESFTYVRIEGIAIDELNIFLFVEPWMCNHCKRIFGSGPNGHKLYEEDLFDELANEVFEKDLKEYLEGLNISDQILGDDDKCPLCFSKLDFDKWFSEIRPQLIGRHESVVEYKRPFEVRKYKCQKCNEYFFSVVYTNYSKENNKN